MYTVSVKETVSFLVSPAAHQANAGPLCDFVAGISAWVSLRALSLLAG